MYVDDARSVSSSATQTGPRCAQAKRRALIATRNMLLEPINEFVRARDLFGEPLDENGSERTNMVSQRIDQQLPKLW